MEFKLRETFINNYKNIKPAFGFNGLGELVYLRTYSRIKDDGTNEKWHETIQRVVEGTYSIQNVIYFIMVLAGMKIKLKNLQKKCMIACLI